MAVDKLGRPRLLVVDDDFSLARQLARFFEGRRMEVRISLEGQTAVDAACGWPADVVLLDAKMPGVDGWEVCRRLRASGYSAPILMLSGYDTERDVVRAHQAGADDHVSKTAKPAVLVAKVERALARERSRSSTTSARSAHERAAIPPRVSGIRDLLRRCDALGLAAAGLELTRLEEHILTTLACARGAVVAADCLVEEGWGRGSATAGALRQSIVGLRKKVKPQGWQIRNVHGRGYRLERRPRASGWDWAGPQPAEKPDTPARDARKKTA
jgi:DNA-binding response OmpR family regulator